MSPPPPFRVERADPTVTLTLDTPGASVNVFGPQAALQLREVLEALPGVELLVLRSGKPGSFINGAGLLYAHAMQSPEVAVKASAEVRAVYEKLAGARPLTAAVIEGNCYGCGLELALCCDVRVARATETAEFRMTELTEYRFVPLFGGTWRLPRAVGVAGAGELLLDGAVWNARRALRRGLVDAVLPSRAGEAELQALLLAIRDGRFRPRRHPGGGPLRALVPPTRAALWNLAARLLRESGQIDPPTARRRELEAFAVTVSSRPAKRAMAFFFSKHAARAASLGNARRDPPLERIRLPAYRGRFAHVAGASLCFAPSRRACEVSVSPGQLEVGRQVARALEWRGLDVVLTRGSGRFVAARLNERSRKEVAALMAEGVSPARINGALWEAGFARPFRWRGWPSTRAGGADPSLVVRLALAWQEVIDAALADGALLHRAQGDVLVQLWHGFPLEEESLSRWLARQPLAAAAEEARP